MFSFGGGGGGWRGVLMGCVAATPPAERSESGSEPQNIRKGVLLSFPVLSEMKNSLQENVGVLTGGGGRRRASAVRCCGVHVQIRLDQSTAESKAAAWAHLSSQKALLSVAGRPCRRARVSRTRRVGGYKCAAAHRRAEVCSSCAHLRARARLPGFHLLLKDQPGVCVLLWRS